MSEQLPTPAFPDVLGWFISHEVRLLVTRGRRSKSGDFRPPRNGSLPVISVNKTLNPYAFLITLVHEMAHFHVYEKQAGRTLLSRRKRVSPHGKEWKEEFRVLMNPFLSPEIFPLEVLEVLTLHLRNPRASTYSDPRLARILIRFDATEKGVLIEEVPEGTLFKTASGMLFRKEGRLRRRYRCIRMKDSRLYLFSPLARVFPAEA